MKVIEELKPVDQKIVDLAQRYFDDLIKPVGSLAKLESMTTRYIAITGQLEPENLLYPKKAILLWSSNEDESFIDNLSKGHEPLTYLAQEAGVEILINEIIYKTEIISGTNFVLDCLLSGYKTTEDCLLKDNYDMIAVGIPGAYSLPINWSSLKNCEPHEILEDLQDARLAAMVGALFCAAHYHKLIVMDGLASVIALYIAAKLSPLITMYAVGGCITTEAGQEELLTELGLAPVLRLEIAQGQGEGSMMTFKLFDAGVRAYKEMATFSGGGVHAELEEFSLSRQKVNNGV